MPETRVGLRLALGPAAVILLLVGTDAAARVTNAPVLTINHMAFTAPLLPVEAGKAVTVRNDDLFRHTATLKGAFDLDLKPGQTGTVVFSHAGAFDVICRYHPTMKARIIVKPAAAKRPHR